MIYQQYYIDLLALQGMGNKIASRNLAVPRTEGKPTVLKKFGVKQGVLWNRETANCLNNTD